MLSKFSNEVLVRGADAVLPQNLSDFWLQTLQKCCDDFLDSNFAVDQCSEALDMGDPLLIACVHELLHRRRGSRSEVAADELAEHVTIYALSVTMETIRRQSDIAMAPPTVDNLLSIDRIVAFGKTNPEFARFLRRACVVPDDDDPVELTWFQRLKRTILAHIAES